LDDFQPILIGQVSMQKVKVHRYISGKRPDYAPRSSSEEESEDEEFIVPTRLKQEQDASDTEVRTSFHSIVLYKTRN
jgi:microfibrillar-associated protein 1